jgi:hypothetical protein
MTQNRNADGIKSHPRRAIVTSSAAVGRTRTELSYTADSSQCIDWSEKGRCGSHSPQDIVLIADAAKRRLVLGLLLLLAACNETDAEQCGFEGVKFLATPSYMTGDCDDLPQVTFNTDVLPNDECDQTIVYGDDCSVEFERWCRIDREHVRQNWTLMPTDGGFRGEGRTGIAGSIERTCTSEYSITLLNCDDSGSILCERPVTELR